MKYELVKLNELSGYGATVYTVVVDNSNSTLFGQFILDHKTKYPREVNEILQSISVIGQKTGARQGFFKEKEGKPGDGVCALYDKDESKLRLYCIRYGSVAIVLGGGAIKNKNTRAWQDDEELKRHAEMMIKISADIYRRLKNKEIYWSRDGRELIGLCEFEIE